MKADKMDDLVTKSLVGPLWLGAPAISQAELHRLRLAKRFSRFAGQFQDAASLSVRLIDCKKAARCKSGACPTCLTFAQRRLVKQLLATIEADNGVDTKQLVALSIMSPAWQAPAGHPHELDPVYLKTDLIRALRQTDRIAWLWAGLDISLNDDTQKGHGVYWQAQAYGVALVDDPKAFAKALRKQFWATENISRPVRVMKCDGTAKALSYCFKTNFVRRIAYLGTGITRSGEPRRCWRTRKVWLKAKEDVELRFWLHRIGLASRILCDFDRFKQKK
jgi:hypothetical protein